MENVFINEAGLGLEMSTTQRRKQINTKYSSMVKTSILELLKLI